MRSVTNLATKAPQRIVRGVMLRLLSMLLVVTPGCGLERIARVNHLHDDGNEKLAQQASDEFEAFSRGQAGLGPVLLKNLEARTGLRRAVAVKTTALDESDSTTTLIATSWYGLRTNTYAALGLEVRPRGDELEQLRQTIRDNEPRLNDAVTLRIQKVAAIAKVLEALTAGNQLVLKRAKEQLEKSLTALDEAKKRAAAATTTATAPATTTTAATTTATSPATRAATQPATAFDLLERFRDAVIHAGEKSAENDKLRAEAQAYRQELLDAIRASRDPATAYALVALVGSGLTTDTALQLENFLATLNDRLKELEDLNRPRKEQDDEERELVDTILAAKAIVLTVSAATPPSEIEKLRERGVELTPTTNDVGEAKALLQTWSAAPESNKTFVAAPRKSFGLAAVPPTVEMADVARLKSTVELLDAAANHLATNANGVTLQAQQLRTELNKFPEKARAAASKATAERAARALRALETKKVEDATTKGRAGPLKGTPVGAEAEALDQAEKSPDAKLGEQFLANFLGRNDALRDQVRETVNKIEFSEKDLAQIGQLVKEINAEGEAATQRLLEFITELYRVRVNLIEENVRHYRTMTAIAIQEVKRWKIIAQLNTEAAEVYLIDAPPDSALVSVFADSDHVDGWRTHYRNLLEKRYPATTRSTTGSSTEPASQPATRPARWERERLAHADVQLNDSVLTSVRRLADNARAWQWASPNTTDPTGWNTKSSMDRLQKAVSAIKANVLTTSVNQRLGFDNSIRLRQELEEHDLHLDGLAARVDEAEIRLGLGDLLAFHRSGITDEDIQAAIGLLQTAALSIIAEGI